MTSMRTIRLAIYCLLVSAVAVADNTLADRHCKTSIPGRVICPPPNGSIATDPLGNVVCGRGECLKNAAGVWMCSIELGGHVGRNASGQVVCTGGCEPAAANTCETAR